MPSSLQAQTAPCRFDIEPHFLVFPPEDPLPVSVDFQQLAGGRSSPIRQPLY